MVIKKRYVKRRSEKEASFIPGKRAMQLNRHKQLLGSLYRALLKQAKDRRIEVENIGDLYKGLKVPYSDALKAEIERLTARGKDAQHAETLAKRNLTRWGIKKD